MDKSEVAVAAIVNKNGRRDKEGSERKHISIEKEAHVIRDCVKRTLLSGRYFILKTNQKQLLYMLCSDQR